jgi:hypothetical protein
MEQSFHISSKGRIRHSKRKNNEAETLSIIKAEYLCGYKILIYFFNSRQRVVDFQPIFLKYVKGEYSKYFEIGNFKKFVIKDGNISWGKNEDIIFPVAFLYKTKHGETQREEVVYVI